MVNYIILLNSKAIIMKYETKFYGPEFVVNCTYFKTLL